MCIRDRTTRHHSSLSEFAMRCRASRTAVPTLACVLLFRKLAHARAELCMNSTYVAPRTSRGQKKNQFWSDRNDFRTSSITSGLGSRCQSAVCSLSFPAHSFPRFPLFWVTTDFWTRTPWKTRVTTKVSRRGVVLKKKQDVGTYYWIMWPGHADTQKREPRTRLNTLSEGELHSIFRGTTAFGRLSNVVDL